MKLHCLALALACAAGAASAQTSGWTTQLSATGVSRAETGVEDSDAQLRSNLAAFRASFTTETAPGTRAGVSFLAESLDYRFSGTSPNFRQWGDVERFGLALPVTRQLGDGWLLLATPSVELMRETGASAGDSIIWAGLLGGIKSWAPDRQLGLGVQLMRRFDETLAVPVIFVDWNLGGGWSIANPLPTSPTGPAGLELRYRFSPALTGGVGASWRSYAFRLEDRPGQTDQIGIDQSTPVFAQLSYAVTPQLQVQVAAGIAMNGQLEVQNNSGDTLAKRDLGNATIFGINLRGRF